MSARTAPPSAGGRRCAATKYEKLARSDRCPPHAWEMSDDRSEQGQPAAAAAGAVAHRPICADDLPENSARTVPKQVKLSFHVVAWYEGDIDRWAADPMWWQAVA